MSYINRHPTTKSAGRAELMYLLVVVIAGFGTAWWAGHKIGFNLSSVTSFASVLGLRETGRSAHGAAGHQPNTVVETDQPPLAPHCGTGQTPVFKAGLATLKQQLGDAMGAPIECEHPTSPAGDTIQATTSGLAVYNQSTNTVSFTDGWRHWAMTGEGLVAWEGTDSSPPLAVSPAA